MPIYDDGMLIAAHDYTNIEWIVHPLSSPDSKEKSPGKRPIEKEWQKRLKPRTNIEIMKYWGPDAKETYNIGLQCGRISNVLVIDIDDWNPAIMDDLLEESEREVDLLISKHSEGRAHLFFYYTPDLCTQKHHDLGIEILSDGNNVVLPPSRHHTGSIYRFNRNFGDEDDLPQMPTILVQKLKNLFSTNEKLKYALGKCKPCLRDKFTEHQKSHNVKDWHGSDGRLLTIAFLADLAANGADFEVMDLACKYIFRERYDRTQTHKELNYIDKDKPWKCSTICSELKSITVKNINPFTLKCDTCSFRHQNPSQNPNTEAEKTIETKKVNPFDIDFDEEDISPELIRQAEDEAKRILAEGDPVEYILNTIKKTHTGDENTQEAIAVSIACQSCLNTAGLQISVNGESGSGKSHGLKTHLHLIPRKYKRETSLSAKAAYYMNLASGMILFSDDKDPDPDFEEVIKRATTNFQQETLHTTVKDHTTKQVIIPPRINWYLTSVESHVSDQLLNRQLTFDTDSSTEQDNRVFEIQKAEAIRGKTFGEVTLEVLICRRIYSKIKENLFKVKIPFASELNIRDKSNRRLFPMFLDMIRGYTIFKFMQRKEDEEGYLIAQNEDGLRAKRLFEAQKVNVITKLNAKETKIINYILQHEDCTIAAIANGTGYSYYVVSRILKGRADRFGNSGLLNKLPGLTMYEQIITDSQANGNSKGRKAEHFRLKNCNSFELFDFEFIQWEETKPGLFSF